MFFLDRQPRGVECLEFVRLWSDEKLNTEVEGGGMCPSAPQLTPPMVVLELGGVKFTHSWGLQNATANYHLDWQHFTLNTAVSYLSELCVSCSDSRLWSTARETMWFPERQRKFNVELGKFSDMTRPVRAHKSRHGNLVEYTVTKSDKLVDVPWTFSVYM